jgi:hypothetical protein
MIKGPKRKEFVKQEKKVIKEKDPKREKRKKKQIKREAKRTGFKNNSQKAILREFNHIG